MEYYNIIKLMNLMEPELGLAINGNISCANYGSG